MSVITKKMHVHFDDASLRDNSVDDNDKVDPINTSKKLNYTREELVKLRNSITSRNPPKMAEADSEQHVDDRLKEKINFIIKLNNNLNKRLPDSKYRRNDTDIASGNSETTNEPNKVCSAPNEEERFGFQQLMATAATQQKSNQHGDRVEHETQRKRIGSGRITENMQTNCWNGIRYGSGNEKENNFQIKFGVDYRYVNNDFFDKRTDQKYTGNNDRKYGRDFDWNNRQKYKKNSTNNNDLLGENRYNHKKTEEPEWMNCGPISQDDIIELHGFTDHDNGKCSTNTAAEGGQNQGNITSPPPARSTPAKSMAKKHDPSAGHEEYFNFEDFLKLDLPSGSHSNKIESGESRFKRWFRRDTSPKHGKNNMTAYDMNKSNSSNKNYCSSEQFFNLVQQSNVKKSHSNLTSSSLKFRSVEELEADLRAPTTSAHNYNKMKSNQDMMAFKNLFGQAALAKDEKSTAINIFDIINKNAQEVLQNQLAQRHTLKRPEAQALLQRLARNEISQLHILQQLNNPMVSQRDRETLMAVINFCNESHRLLQQQQQLAQKQQMVQQFCNLQMNMTNGMVQQRPPTPQELQLHTQTIMQNALIKKQVEDQYRKLQQHQNGHSSLPYPDQYASHLNMLMQNQNFNPIPKQFNQQSKDGFQLKPLSATSNLRRQSYGQKYNQNNNLSGSAVNARNEMDAMKNLNDQLIAQNHLMTATGSAYQGNTTQSDYSKIPPVSVNVEK